MKKAWKMGLIGFVLGAAVAVGSATVGSEETVAAPCCSNCMEPEECPAFCGSDTACLDSCVSFANRCPNICNLRC